MFRNIIDAHIHIDDYGEEDQNRIINDLEDNHIDALISVSNSLKSAKKTQLIASRSSKVKPAFGFHPEQILPSELEITKLITFIEENIRDVVAIGEIGLPFYLKQEDSLVQTEPYMELLENFILLSKQHNKPVVLHAVYEDASLACELLEKHSIRQAHFHWFKGDENTIERLISNEYHISVTPDICYKDRTQKLIKKFPLDLTMVETDGPWTFSGPFKDQITHPKMLHMSIRKIANIKRVPVQDVYQSIYNTTKSFYLPDC